LGIFSLPDFQKPGQANFYNTGWERVSAAHPQAGKFSGMPVGYMDG
jgi:hypothetical protein